MAYNNTIFRQILQLISRLEFQNVDNRLNAITKLEN